MQVVSDFFKAFNNQKANQFTARTMAEHYKEAIMYHHPRKENLDPSDIGNKTQALVGGIFSSISAIGSQPELLGDTIKKLGRKAENRNPIWFPEFDEAYDSYRKNSKLPLLGEFLLPPLDGVGSLVDFGCGDGEIAIFLRDQLGIEEVTGIDILDWRGEKAKCDGGFKFYRHDFSKADEADLPVSEAGIMHAILHHVSNNGGEISQYLETAKEVIGSKLLVVEDVLYSGEDFHLTVPGSNTLRERIAQQPNFADFTKLSLEEQREVITILDLLSNSLALGIPEMNFPFGARELSGWIDIFENAGFTLQKVQVLGFQEHLFHRMSQVLFVLNK